MNIGTALLSPQSIDNLAWVLLHSLWQGLVICALYASLVRLAGSRLGSQARYSLACLSLCSLVTCPILTFLSLRLPSVQTYAMETGPIAGMTAWQTFAPWVVTIWLAGAAVFLVRLAGGWLAAAQLRRSGVSPAPPEWQLRLDRLCAHLPVSRRVTLLVSSRIEAPVMMGWLRPVILAPAGAIAGLPTEYVEALLMHELAHIRRHDYLVNVLQNFAEAVFFYHPAVWWLSSQVRREREYCCDDVAAAASGDAFTYASALTELESCRPRHLHPALGATDGSLAGRVRRILERDVRLSGGKGLVAGLALGILLLAGTSAATLEMFAQQPSQPNASSAASERELRNFVEQMQGALAEVRNSLQSLREAYAENHPEIQNLRSEVERLAAEFRATQQNARDAETAARVLEAHKADIEAERRELERSLAEMRRTYTNSYPEVKRLKEKLDVVAQNQAKIADNFDRVGIEALMSELSRSIEKLPRNSQASQMRRMIGELQMILEKQARELEGSRK